MKVTYLLWDMEYTVSGQGRKRLLWPVYKEMSWKIIPNHTRTSDYFEAMSDPFEDLGPSKSWARPATPFRRTRSHCTCISSVDHNGE
jgi:hypothetical protein